jgi:rod shape-determining protein MreC
MDYVPLEEKIEVGEMLYTSGDDRIFPRGFPAGIVKVVRNAQPFKEVLVEPTGLQHGLDDVLIVVQGVHQEIPSAPAAGQPVYLAPPPPPDQKAPAVDTTAAPAAGQGTEADRLRAAYKAVGDAQNHTFGEGLPGSKPPDFTKLPMGPAAAAGAAAAPPAASGPAKPAAPAVTPPATPPAAKPAAPPANVPPASTAPPKQPDAQRKANQAAGAGPGQGQVN